MTKLDAAEIRQAARGQWLRILESVCGLNSRQLNPKIHGPCPKCDGTDRFRALDDVAESGALFCNQCHNGDTLPKSGDGLSSVQWLLGCGFSEALRQVAAEVGKMPRTSVGEPKTAAGTGGAKIHATTEAAADALAWGMTQNGILTEQRKSDSGWRYRNADGSDAGAVLRWDLSNGRKEIRQVSAVTGGWICRAIPEPRPLYRLPQMLAADAAEIVWIVEGEKAADVGPTLGLCCVTSSGGSNAAEKTDWKPVQGRRVVIVPDNDEPGEKYAADVARLCHAAGAVSVAVLRLPTIWPQCPVGGDLADFSEAFDSRTADELRAMLEGAAVESVEVTPDDETIPRAVELFEVIDSAVFAVADFHQEFWIEDVLAAGQPQLWGGPSKALKTSLLVDQCLSLAAAVPFMGRFEVPKPRRVLLLSSESGKATLQETAGRICEAKGISLQSLGDRLQWGFRPPQLTDLEHLAALTEFVQLQKFDLVAIDPAYLSLNMDSAEAANQFAVGALLQRLTTLQADTGAVPVLAAHFRKFNSTGEMPTLENIAGAGFGQWARQWFLLNRQEAFNPDNPGSHKLLAAWGGSAGHCGGLAVFVEEGRREDGRTWDVQLHNLTQVQADRTDKKEQRKREKQAKTEEQNRWAVLQALKFFPQGETKTKIRQNAKLNPDTFEPIWTQLLTAEEVCQVTVDRGEKKANGTPKTYDGWRLVLSEDRLKNTKNSEEQ